MPRKATTLHEFIVWLSDDRNRISEKIIYIRAPKKKPADELKKAIFKHYPQAFHAEFIGAF